MLKETSTRMPPSAILAIMAGALMVAGGLVVPSIFGVWTGGFPGWMSGNSMMGCPGCSIMMSGSSLMWAMVGIMAVISIGAGAVSIVGGYSIYKKPASSTSWGIAILVQ
jgi:hypothetical protein